MFVIIQVDITHKHIRQSIDFGRTAYFSTVK